MDMLLLIMNMLLLHNGHVIVDQVFWLSIYLNLNSNENKNSDDKVLYIRDIAALILNKY